MSAIRRKHRKLSSASSQTNDTVAKELLGKIRRRRLCVFDEGTTKSVMSRAELRYVLRKRKTGGTGNISISWNPRAIYLTKLPAAPSAADLFFPKSGGDASVFLGMV